MIDFKEVIDYCQAEAIANKLSPNELSVWRSICREYSVEFNTPLFQVESLDPEHVILNVFERQLESIDEDKIENLHNMLETILSVEDPEYESVKNKEFEDDMEQYEKEEEERIRKGQPVHPSLAKNNEPTLESKKEFPKSGGIDLSYLEGEEQ